MTRKRVWTEERCDKLRSLYADITNREIAAILGVSEKAVDGQAYALRLRKSHAFMSEHARKGQFKKGHEPFNKGKKIREWCPDSARERMKNTMFQKGDTPWNTQHLGAERVTKDGYIEVKTAEHGKTNSDRWTAKQRVVWEKHNGAIPPGYIVVFKDGDKRNFDISNLELRSRQQHGAATSASLPIEYKQMIQLKGALRRQINKANSKDNDTDRDA